MKSVTTKKLLMLLLGVSLGASSMHANSKKTFMMPRPVGQNKTMEFSPWDLELYALTDKNKCLHGRFQVTPFYQASTNRADVGEYFGIGNGKNSFTVGARYNFNAASLTPSGQLPINTFVTNPTEVDGALLSGNDTVNQFFNGTVTFNPSQEIVGARVDMEYSHNPQSGFYVNVAVPFVSVTNNMNMTIANNQPIQIAIASTTPFLPTGPSFTLADFFAGNVTIPASIDPADRRDPLIKSKIAGKTTQGGVADLDLTVGYRHNCCGTRHYAANIRFTLPTGNQPNGCNLFEPVVGNGQHVGLGAGVDAGFQVWNSADTRIWLEGGLQFKYLFEHQEVRMLGVKGFNVVPPLAQYCLMSTVQGASTQGTPLFPAANQLTRAVNVTPGCHVDALVDLSFQMKNVVFDVGYNLYWREKESVSVRNWEDNTYGILDNTILTSAEEDGDDFLNDAFVNRANLDTSVAQTPSQLSNKIHAGAMYRSTWGDWPTNLGIGASYEVANTNAVLNQYAVWLKGNIAW